MIKTWIDGVQTGCRSSVAVLDSAPRPLARAIDEVAWQRW
jgi:hypothetical protein